MRLISPDTIKYILIGIPAFIISGSIHEFFHAFAAWRLGDDTAKRAGRLTLNPIPHIDLIGSIAFPLFGAFAGFVIGWMKPVPVNRLNLKNPSRDHAVTAFAGPFSNFLQASCWLILLKLLVISGIGPEVLFKYAYFIIGYFILINLVLMIFNLLPIPPLDGGWILRYFLPVRAKEFYDKYIKYGFIVLFLLLFLGGFRFLFTPVTILFSIIQNNIVSTHFFVFCLPAVFAFGVLAFFLKDDIKTLLRKLIHKD